MGVKVFFLKRNVIMEIYICRIIKQIIACTSAYCNAGLMSFGNEIMLMVWCMHLTLQYQLTLDLEPVSIIILKSVIMRLMYLFTK